MKLLSKLNLLSFGIVLVMTGSVLGIGMLILGDILYKFENQVSQLELANVSQVVLQRLNRSGVRAAAEAAVTLESEIKARRGLKSTQLYIVESPDNRIVYQSGQAAGEKYSSEFVDQMFSRNKGSIEYDIDGVSYFAVFTTIEPMNWLIGLSVSKSEMLAKRSDFLGAIGGLTFVILLLNALLVRFFGQRMLKRIDMTLDCVNRIEQGDLSARIPAVTAHDEIGRLQEGINAMSAKIQQRTLAQQVAEDALREREARIRRIVDANIIGIFFWNAAGDIYEANEAFLSIIGYSPADLAAGRVRWSCLTPPEYRAVDHRAFEEALATGRCAPYEKQYFRKDGTRISVLVGGALLEGGDKNGVAFVLDLSERKQAEADRQARHTAEAASRTKSEFLANMSHELRTPLSAVLGYAQILKRDKGLSERQLNGLNTIQQSGEHLLTLITDLLDLAKIEAGKFELSLGSVHLPTLLQVVAGIIRVQAEQKGLQFQCEMASDLPSSVLLDEKRLRQVLLNLLGNAVKFTERGAISLHVRHAMESTEQVRLVFEVADTGVGMRPDQLETVFLPFEQVGGAEQRAAGTGLGLSITRQLIRLMGDEIQVGSQYGVGSVFRFELLAACATSVSTGFA